MIISCVSWIFFTFLIIFTYTHNTTTTHNTISSARRLDTTKTTQQQLLLLTEQRYHRNNNKNNNNCCCWELEVPLNKLTAAASSGSGQLENLFAFHFPSHASSSPSSSPFFPFHFVCCSSSFCFSFFFVSPADLCFYRFVLHLPQSFDDALFEAWRRSVRDGESLFSSYLAFTWRNLSFSSCSRCSSYIYSSLTPFLSSPSHPVSLRDERVAHFTTKRLALVENSERNSFSPSIIEPLLSLFCSHIIFFNTFPQPPSSLSLPFHVPYPNTHSTVHCALLLLLLLPLTSSSLASHSPSPINSIQVHAKWNTLFRSHSVWWVGEKEEEEEREEGESGNCTLLTS